MEKALAAIHQANHERQPITLEYGIHEGRVALFVRSTESIEQLVTNPLTAHYPNCSIATIEDVGGCPPGWETWTADLELTPELFPILRHAQFEDMLNHNFADPVSGILRAIKPDEHLTCRIEIIVAPAIPSRAHRAVTCVKRLDREFFRHHHRLARYYALHITRPHGWLLAWLLGLIACTTAEPPRTPLDTSTSRLHEREDDLQAASDKIGGHLFETHIRLSVSAPAGRHHEALNRIRQMAGAFGAFTKSRLATFRLGRLRRGRLPLRGRGFLLSHEELATLWHPPTATVLAESMQTTDFTELQAPTKLYSGKEEGAVTLGRVKFRDDAREFGLSQEDRRRHLYIVGKTGMGKTTLLENLILSDLQVGRGVCLIDPHGDLATAIISKTPTHRTNDVIVFDAADREYAISFNPLACRDPAMVDQVTSGVVSAFKKLHDSWGPRLEDTLRNAVFAIVEQGGTMLSLLRMLAEPAYRSQIVARIQDEIVRSFWLHEFAAWDNRYRTEAIAAIQNKVRPFLTSRSMRAIVSQPNHSIDLRSIMDSGKALIVNLSKGRVGEDNATLLGAFLVTAIQQAALTRAEIPEANRRDFFLYVDEFQNFATSSFATILSEARKYRLTLTIAHQYVKQLDDMTRNAVFGNVGSVIAFQVGADDAEALSLQLAKFAGQLKVQDLTNLPKFTAYLRLLIDGMPSGPFSMETVAPYSMTANRFDIVSKCSRRKNARLVHQRGDACIHEVGP